MRLLLVTLAVAAWCCGTLWGCSAQRPPLAVIEPTYSHVREPMAQTQTASVDARH